MRRTHLRRSIFTLLVVTGLLVSVGCHSEFEGDDGETSAGDGDGDGDGDGETLMGGFDKPFAVEAGFVNPDGAPDLVATDGLGKVHYLVHE